MTDPATHETVIRPGAEYRTHVLQNVLWSYAGWATTILTPLVMVPLYVRFLGAKTYGEWLIILSITSYLGLANLGLGQTVSNQIAEAAAVRREPEITTLLATAFVSYSMMAVALLAALAVLTPILAARLHLDKDSGLLLAFAVYVALNLASFPLRIFPMLLRGFQRVDQEQQINVVASVMRIATLAIFLYAGFKLLAIAIINGAVGIVSTTAAYLWTRGLGAQTRFRLSDFSSRLLRALIRPSVGFLGIQAGATLIMGVDNLVIGYAIGSVAVTRYAVPYRLTYMATSLFIVGMGAFGPTLTALFVRGAHAELRRWLLLAMRAALLYATAGAIALWIAGPSFIRLWAGPGIFPDTMTFGLQICQFWSMVWVAAASALLWSTTRHYVWSAVTVIEGVLNLVLSLCAVWRWGTAGVIGATVAASVLTEFWYLPRAAFRLLQIPVQDVARELLAPIAVCAVAMVSVLLIWPAGSALPPWHRTVIVTASAETVFAIAYLSIGCSRADRRAALDWFEGWRSQLNEP